MTKRWNTVREKPELLIPAKDLEVLCTAVRFGADAVYIGGESFSLRAKARNFSQKDMAEGIAFAHARGVKVHVAANVFAHNRDLEGAAGYFDFLGQAGPDAILVADPGMFSLAKKHCPQIPIHISTQANSTNYETFRFWHSLGAARVVCARELSIEEIAQVREKTPPELEIEAFIHGAMCISYSGRCLLSSWFTGRDANRGACTHPCRWRYAVVEESRPGEYFPVEETERGTFLFNSRDLCMIEHLPELARAGVDSLKIEGRMKTALYVASITRAYRHAIDDYLESDEKYAEGLPRYREEIRQCTYRDFTTGFYFGRPDAQSMVYTDNTYSSGAVFLGIVEDEGTLPEGAFGDPEKDPGEATANPAAGSVELVEAAAHRVAGFTDSGEIFAHCAAGAADPETAPAYPAADPEKAPGGYPAVIRQKNKFSAGDVIEIMRPDGKDRRARVLEMRNAAGERVQSAPHPGELIRLMLDEPAEPGDILRMEPR